jgi:hypothetical protein
MKNDKISLEIATLKKALLSPMPKVVKEKVEAKIERLEKELKGSTQSGVEFAKSLLSGKKKVKGMAKVDFNALIKSLSQKPEYSFLKALTRKQIEDDLDREAKPLGYRYVGRKNFKIPTKADIKAKRGVYYENRSNRMDINRSVRLAKGGEVYEKLEVGVYRVGKPSKVVTNLYEQKIVEIFKNGDIATASDYARSLSEFKGKRYESYPIITLAHLENQYKKFENGGRTEDQTKRKVNPKKMVKDGEDTFFLTYIDPTHFYLSNDLKYDGSAYHIGQFRGEVWYDDAKSWLKTHPKMAKGGDIGGME